MPYETLELSFKNTEGTGEGRVATLCLNRPETANAFNAMMMEDLTRAFRELKDTKDCRILILRGAGKHFSGGADLNWMRDSAVLSQKENLAEARKMASMFEMLYSLPFPTIGVIHGAAFGGATGLTACCDIAIAAENTRFCLSEVRLGILPAVILPYLSLRMPSGALRRLSMTARPFSGKEAMELGLVDLCCPPESLEKILLEEVNALLGAGPEALGRLKSLQQALDSPLLEAGREKACEAIALARSGEEAQAGFRAFFAKESPPWVSSIRPD